MVSELALVLPLPLVDELPIVDVEPEASMVVV